MGNRTCFITGASRGIGRAIARKFLEEGYNLALNYRKDEDKQSLEEEFEQVKKDCQLSSEIIYLKGDVRHYDQCEEMYKACVEAFGKVDVLINNAGITRDNLAVRMKNEDFYDVMEVNLYSCFYFMKLFGKHMMKNRYGRIISISSIVGLRGNAGQVNYAASKAGIIGMTKSLAKELSARSVTVNAIAPGFVKSDMTDKLSDKVKDSILASIPTGSFAEGEDIANAALFLASDSAKQITGQVISVDGGMSI
ncbi:3-oxoacyl-[acyl-carrier-protein] reductase [Atopobacter sp. AH10]|uniref:3-oxoacyl-[acyl-carrier-protein] reductase n=1 Tax=Atopobacter sp. AH10 TaxID=2315861 RepID=UPI000EF19A76|nr:3-oxoacyl-[acyl-carrier-protein] reductase [Atopobacter sp. AH10]RLK63056.1 3-oxoacyl-[acyl-carrier-protein] reductase [Atopobacter sp. AH10]